MLESKWAEGKFLCVGLDSELDKIRGLVHPARGSNEESIVHLITAFNVVIVDATYDLVCAYKPNIAFYEACGTAGLTALRLTIEYIHCRAPDVPVILDAKRADIGNTNAGYVKAAFNILKVDAITVHPYLGEEALRPFLDCTDKGVIVLCRTSNPGAGEFQDLHTLTRDPRNKPEGMTAEEWLNFLCDDSMRLYERVAFNVATKWNKKGNCQLVVGATYPTEASNIRRLIGDVPFLIPGIGAQGGDVEATVLATADSCGWGMIINSSRSIIFAENPRREAQKLRDLINQYRK